MSTVDTVGDFVIRHAKEEDCEEIYRLIKELAVYEKMPEQVAINPEVLRRDGFGDHKFFSCLVATENKPPTDTEAAEKLVGYAMYYYVYSTWNGRVMYIEDLYVSPDHRGKGIGTRFWKNVAQIALENECTRIQFVVLNWNKSSIEFYKRKGAFDLTVEEKWHLFRMCQPEMEKLAKS